MNAKLTLTIEESVIEKAKLYAKAQKRSLSNLIEEYLKSIVGDEKIEGIPLTPIAKSLKGAVKLPKDYAFDEKQILEDELIKKYLR